MASGHSIRFGPFEEFVKFVANNWLGNYNQAKYQFRRGHHHRLACAIAEAVERGFLQADQNWHLDVSIQQSLSNNMRMLR